MLEKIYGGKYMALIGAALLLTACSSTDTSTEAPTETVVEPTVPAEPVAPVEAEVIDEGPAAGTQESLDASASNGLVYFGYDRYDLTSDARAALQAQASWMNENTMARMTIEGHCDERGTREYNLALGDRRANSVKNYLVALGVNPSRLRTVSYGKERPVVIGSGESSWAQNRRGYTRVN